MRKIFEFHGGLHLPDNKAQSTGCPVIKAALPERLIIPLQQHIGEPSQPVVKVGENVLKGQLIAQARGYISANIHASSSGRVVEIGKQPVPHPSGLPGTCILIDTDGRDQWVELDPIADFQHTSLADLREKICAAGIVGLGGATFPTSVKLDTNQKIEKLIINGAECEPYISCDDMLMREKAESLLTGVAIMRHVLQAGECLIGIEDNKPEAIAAMTSTINNLGMTHTEVVVIPTLYPSGGEKQLIYVLTGKEIPSGDVPTDIGMICQNVGTAAAISDAIISGKPLISRYVTLTGEGVNEPSNMEVLIGTPVQQLIEQAGGYTDSVSHLIVGGPMMGFTLRDDNVPVTKAVNCLFATSNAEAPDPGIQSPCIRCGDCADVCPVNLLPQQLYWHTRARNLEKTQEYNLFDCIECGCCSHVCPSHIPLVHYYRYAKQESWDQERERAKSDIARERFEARKTRLARMEAERKARLRKKKDALTQGAKGKDAKESDPKKAAIQAAIKRAAEKKAGLQKAGFEPKNTEQLTPEQQQRIEQADARRKAG